MTSLLRFPDHTQRHTTAGRTPLDEWSARRRDLYMTTPTLTRTYSLYSKIREIDHKKFITVTISFQCLLRSSSLGYPRPKRTTLKETVEIRSYGIKLFMVKFPKFLGRPTYIHVHGGIRTHSPNKRAAANLCLRPHSLWGVPQDDVTEWYSQQGLSRGSQA
jgi:hypothetical protein